MKRAPIVLVATAAGLAGVMSFHTRSASLTPGAAAATSTTSATSPSSSAATTTPPSATSPSSSTSHSTSTTAPGSTTTTAPVENRSATGAAVDYNYGVLSVSVSVSSRHITNVTIASIDEGGNQLSESIDQRSIPTLEQEALQAQSANIQSVSGASYTSAGFVQSLQSALTKLGL